MLTIVAVDQTVSDIMNEISFYVTISDNDVDTARRAIRTLGDIAVKLSVATEQSLTYLLDFLDTDVPHVLSETFVVLKDILRKYRNNDFCSTYLPQITKHWRTISDTKALISFVWILGEFGAFIDSAPYILESYVDTFDKQHYSVRLELLTATVKLFFGRAPETQKMLGRLFEAAIQDTSHADVHDRALFYYRLLKTNPTMARQVICSQKSIVTSFCEEESAELREKLFSEYNSLSVVYGKPAERFIITGPAVLGAEQEDEEEEEEEEEEYDEEFKEVEEEEDYQAGNEGRMKQRLLDDEEGDTPQAQSLEEAMNPMAAQASPAKMQAIVQFPVVANPKPLMPGDYQAKWKSAQTVKNYSFNTKTRPNPNDVEALVRSFKIMCIAASKNNDPAMFYMYAQREKTEEYFMIECKIYGNGRVDCVVKNDKNNGAELDGFYEFYKSIFSRYM